MWIKNRGLLKDKYTKQPLWRQVEGNILLNKLLISKNTHCLLYSIHRGEKCKRTEVFHSAKSSTVMSHPKICAFQLTTLWLKILWNDAKQFSTRCQNILGSQKKIPSFNISMINNVQKEVKVIKLPFLFWVGFLGVCLLGVGGVTFLGVLGFGFKCLEM